MTSYIVSVEHDDVIDSVMTSLIPTTHS